MKYFRGKSSWDKAFKSGIWDYLSKDFSEITRQSLVSSLILIISQNEKFKVLDLGCGEGVIKRFLPKTISYTGLDISSEVIEKASKKHPDANFIIENIGNLQFYEWSKNNQFDFIVLNEVVYYLNSNEYKNLINSLEILSKNNKRSNYIIASICKTDKNNLYHSSYYWSKLFETFKHIYSVDINDNKHSWEIKVFSTNKRAA